MKTILLMDIVIAFVGIYLAVAAFRMKKSGTVSDLVVPQEEIKKCKDPKAYVNGIVPYMYFFAVVSFVVGVIGILCDTKVLAVGRIWTYVELIAFLAAFAFFYYGMRRVKERYFR